MITLVGFSLRSELRVFLSHCVWLWFQHLFLLTSLPITWLAAHGCKLHCHASK